MSDFPLSSSKDENTECVGVDLQGHTAYQLSGCLGGNLRHKYTQVVFFKSRDDNVFCTICSIFVV